jgi:hypothetical protein
VGPATPDSPPTIEFQKKTITYSSDETIPEYNMDNLNRRTLPIVFVDDPPMDGLNNWQKAIIDRPYIVADATDNVTISNQNAFIVVRSRRNQAIIRVQASDVLRW